MIVTDFVDDETHDAFLDRAFSTIKRPEQPLGASHAGFRRSNVVALEAEIRDAMVQNPPSARRAELDYNVFRRTQGAHGILSAPARPPTEYKWKS